LLEALRDYFGIREDDGEEAVRDKVAGRSLRLDKELDDTLPLLYDFLGVPDPGHPPPPMQPEAKQRRLFGFLKRLTHAQSRREPTVLLFEDLHWWDGGSEAFLENQVEVIAGTRALMVVNFRPEYHVAWMQKSYYQQLPLLPFGRRERTSRLIAKLRAHGLIAKVTRSRLYGVTPRGHRLMSALLTFRHVDFPKAFAAAA
jgi:predicted ATPase